ncbi:TIGR03808 family TAT-translocated repetitive protein [Pseudorhodoplanes sp.]|uniref:TIGR03808 family TAT-translocated repetitive protein n=1 Tax=Pseudorhodoplanes sp. TaxID=1934341 RepID=UPI002CF9A1B0|nr:TIGR03808 family TAT-translocated repetitive protein [Pseudorhodoplanes sp.]HWV54269.1 TIGR03808 family TAT-translocated repetitive protein [Pseudorhodoplanes sp.]
MSITRRTIIAAGSVAAAGGAAPASATPLLGIDASGLGLKPDSALDQTQALQRAIDRAAQARTVLILPPGTYRAAGLRLPPYAKIAGTRGASRIVLAQAASLFTGDNAAGIDLTGLVIDGAKLKPQQGRALVHLTDGQDLRLTDCTIVNAGRNAISLERCSGVVAGCTIEDAGDGALFAIDSTGLRIAGNVIRRSGNNGVQVWRSTFGNDGTIVTDNRIEDTRADSGGDGPYGNAISVFRAGNVMVRGNRIDGCAFSAVRGNSASNIQIADNVCTRMSEVGIYSEFSFEGAVITGNTVDGATIGISVTNFDVGGRLAVVQGNLIRNLLPTGNGNGIGIGIAADSVVTGNVIETAPTAGVEVGYGPYLRDVIVSDNVIRGVGVGVAVSVVPGSGSALIADNLIADAKNGAVVGMEWDKRVTGDMTKDGAGKYAHVTLSGNRVR